MMQEMPAVRRGAVGFPPPLSSEPHCRFAAACGIHCHWEWKREFQSFGRIRRIVNHLLRGLTAAKVRAPASARALTVCLSRAMRTGQDKDKAKTRRSLEVEGNPQRGNTSHDAVAVRTCVVQGDRSHSATVDLQQEKNLESATAVASNEIEITSSNLRCSQIRQGTDGKERDAGLEG
eukprot:2809200-Rhodomonas_salina.1